MSLKNWLIQKVVEREAKKMLDKLEGKKTYITMAVILIFGAIDAYNQNCVSTALCKSFMIPGWVYSLLAALGIYTRAVAKPK